MEPSPFQKIIADLAPALATLVTTLASWALIELTRWIRQKMSAEKANLALTAIDKVVQTVVTDLGATVVKSMKAKAVDGKLTADEMCKVKEEALDRIGSIVPEEMKNQIAPLIGDLQQYVRSKIEHEIEESKKGGITCESIT